MRWVPSIQSIQPIPSIDKAVPHYPRRLVLFRHGRRRGPLPSYLVSPDVSAALPEGYKLRPLRRSDYDTGFLDCLRVLTTVGDIAKDEFEAQYERMVKQEGYYIIVIEDDAGAVVATGALIVERKFIHNLGAVGHIEDIAVSKSQQGKKLGLRLIQALDFVAERIGCYKSILDCSDANEGFYIKCGFRRPACRWRTTTRAAKVSLNSAPATHRLCTPVCLRLAGDGITEEA
ncbi:hypothetical protein ACCO45_009614 [Purpureocillium lilacinum]|uniref:Uncharacterized protein n=1 Tax=Purpureocillium lilacinum TaxID=33203 RepID=A0ACC4DN95_PURLI